MKIYVPDYYINFKCIADKCTDSCCVGWGVYVDDKTLEKYKNVEGDVGRELMSSIDMDGEPCFRCDGSGRCQNLDERGLCEIITTLGENYLCQICRDHPRYFNCNHGRCEGGLGLACEVAADLVLSIDRLPETVEVESDDVVYLGDEENSFIFSMRYYLLSLLFEKGGSVADLIGRLNHLSFVADERMFDILCGTVDENTSANELLATEEIVPFDFDEFLGDCMSIFHDLDVLSLEYGELLSDATANATKNKNGFLVFLNGTVRNYFRNLTYYFIHRYLISDEPSISSNMMLAISMSLAVMAIAFLSEDRSHQNFAKIAKDFSKNIEYSTDNVEILLDRIEEL